MIDIGDINTGPPTDRWSRSSARRFLVSYNLSAKTRCRQSKDQISKKISVEISAGQDNT